MTDRAKKIYTAWEDEYCLQEDFYEYRALAAAIREIVNNHQYYQCCEEAGVEDMVVDARLLYDISNELENLK